MKNWFYGLVLLFASSFIIQCTSNNSEVDNSAPVISENSDTATGDENSQNPETTQVPTAPQQMPQAPVGQGGQASPPPAPVKDGVAQPILPGGLPAPPPNQPPPPPMPIPGSDKDAHGCKASAGFTWSILKQTCIRTFESCTRLNKLQPSGNAQISAFVLFSADNSKAELFMPGSSNSFVLLRNNTGKFWFNEAYRLEKLNNQITLSEWEGHINPRAKMGSFKLPPFKPTYSSK